MQEHKTIQSFLDVVAEQIRWKRARPVVTAELERHLEDQRDAFAEEGLENAEELAVEEMGDRPDVKFCVSVFRQSQEWRWKTGRILA